MESKSNKGLNKMTNQPELILHPSSTAQWRALVNEAEALSSNILDEELESYVVFLLMRFASQPDIAQSILATDFLRSVTELRHERAQMLRDVGDKCLLFAGLFPGRARRRRVRISYFVKLGQAAYSSLSSCSSGSSRTSGMSGSSASNRKIEPLQLGELFGNLRDQFVGIMDILHTMRELKSQQAFLDLLQAEELWQDTKSPHALKTLRKATQGFILSPYSDHRQSNSGGEGAAETKPGVSGEDPSKLH